jgi:hypothetical protein
MLLRAKRIRGARFGAALLILGGAALAQAQAIHIPNSEMPGRERDRFIDLPVPKSQSPDLQPPIWKRTHPGSHQKRASPRPTRQ